MAAARRRSRDEEARARELGASGKEEARDRSVAGEAVRLQELLGNVSATEVMARSTIQRDTATAEATPAKGGEEPKDAKYTMTMAGVGTFPIESWSWGEGSQGVGAGGGGGPGKATFTELSASKYEDKFSALIFQRSASGEHIPTVELRGQRGDETFAIKLKDVNVDAVSASPSDPPMETFKLSFATVEFEHSGEKKK